MYTFNQAYKGDLKKRNTLKFTIIGKEIKIGK